MSSFLVSPSVFVSFTNTGTISVCPLPFSDFTSVLSYRLLWGIKSEHLIIKSFILPSHLFPSPPYIKQLSRSWALFSHTKFLREFVDLKLLFYKRSMFTSYILKPYLNPRLLHANLITLGSLATQTDWNSSPISTSSRPREAGWFFRSRILILFDIRLTLSTAESY